MKRIKTTILLLIMFCALNVKGQIHPITGILPAPTLRSVLISVDTFSDNRLNYDSILFSIINDSLYFTNDISADLSVINTNIYNSDGTLKAGGTTVNWDYTKPLIFSEDGGNMLLTLLSDVNYSGAFPLLVGAANGVGGLLIENIDAGYGAYFGLTDEDVLTFQTDAEAGMFFDSSTGNIVFRSGLKQVSMVTSGQWVMTEYGDGNFDTTNPARYLVDNSAGTVFDITSNNVSSDLVNNGALIDTLNVYGLSSSPWTNTGGVIYPTILTDSVGIGTTVPAARMQIKGTGATSATDALIVQNSALSTLLHIEDGGNIGIGTATPSEELEVNGTIELTNDLRFSGTGVFASGVAQIYDDATNGLIITGSTGATNDLFISNGVGGGIIKTPTGTQDIQLTGYGTAHGSDGAPTSVLGTENTTGDLTRHSMTDLVTALNSEGGISSNWTRNGLDVYPNNTTDSVGIGTTNPTEKLHIYSSTNANMLFHSTNNAAVKVKSVNNSPSATLQFHVARAGETSVDDGNGLGTIQFRGLRDSDGTYALSAYIVAKARQDFTASTVKSQMQFWTTRAGYAGPSQQFTLYDGRYAGFGITAPTAILHVKGYTSNANYDALIVENSSSTDLFHIQDNGNIGIGDANPDAKLQVIGSGATSATDALIVENSALTDLFHIEDGGNIGIGNTTPGYTLDVTGEINATDAYRAGGDAGTSGYLLTSSGGAVNTWTDPSAIGATSKVHLNGLTETTDTVRLGGTLTKTTTIDVEDYALQIDSDNGTKNIDNTYDNAGFDATYTQTSTGQYTQHTQNTFTHNLEANYPSSSMSQVYVAQNSVQLTSDNLSNSNEGNINVFSNFLQLINTDGTNTNSLVIGPEEAYILNGDLNIDGGNFGVGASNPGENIVIHEATSGANNIQLTNTTTGVASTDGLFVGLTATEDAAINQKENNDLYLATNNTIRIHIENAGNIGVGTSAPTEMLDINSDAIRIRTAQTPASASATGTTGMIAWDANYIYVCVATNTWKRTAIDTW